MYQKYVKRMLDFTLSLTALLILAPLMLFLTIMGAFLMKGNPFFVQLRPGKDEKIFHLIKFRTMTNKKDADGELLSDEDRLTIYGKFLRSTSLDELPELINIVKGDMAIVGPRPQLVRDMVFMTAEQRKRHTLRQGLTGLAQVNGRNSMTWEEKLQYDLKYIENVSFAKDVLICFKTIQKVIFRDGITAEGLETAEDYGDYLLRLKKISLQEYEIRQNEALKLMNTIR